MRKHSQSFFLEIVVGQQSPVPIGFQPMIEVNLVEVRGDHLLSQFMSLRTAHGYRSILVLFPRAIFQDTRSSQVFYIFAIGGPE